MAAAAETAKPTSALGRSSSRYNDYAFPGSYTSTTSSPSKRKLRLVTSSSSTTSSSKSKGFGDVYSAGASPASLTTYFPPRSDSRTAGSKMSLSNVGGIASIPAGGRHAKLHKREGSGSSIPSGSSLPAAGYLSQVNSTTEGSYTPTSSTPTGSIPKIRPYLRKMSTKEDSEQGRLDLSKSMSENHALTGLGIQDLGQRSASDVSFTHTAKRSHARNASGDSTASGSIRITNKPFVHPMRQTPRPYTPPHGRSFDSSLNDEERNESDDVLTDDDFRLGHGFRSRRSVSISSTPVVAPTPLSQSHTAFDLGIVPKLTDIQTNGSTSNLSIKSNKSGKSSKSRPSNGGGGGGRSRRNTERSFETPTTTSASARTSLDKAFSFASVGNGGRRSDTDPLTRDQRIQAARRKFEEREEKKERKAAESRGEMEERVRRKSEASERGKKSGGSEKTRLKKGKMEGGVDVRPSGSADVATRQAEWEKSPARPTMRKVDESAAPSGKFSVWLKTRLLSCGRKG